jgi:hypothetical protein
MHASDFKASVTAIGVHENVFEILTVLQKMLPTVVPSLLVAPKKGPVHGTPDVFQAIRVDVVQGCNLIVFVATRRPWFPILVAVSVLAREISNLVPGANQKAIYQRSGWRRVRLLPRKVHSHGGQSRSAIVADVDLAGHAMPA